MPWQTTAVRGVAPLRTVDDKIRFVWATDTHINPSQTDNAEDLQSAVEHCKLIRPQAFVHTGDLGDSTVAQVREGWSILNDCQTRVLVAIGNHDEEEYTTGNGNPNTAPLTQADMWNQQTPFVKHVTLSAGDGSWTALCVTLDCNYYDDTGNEDHEVGDRIGNATGDPPGGYKRMLGDGQIALLTNILAANDSDAVLIFTHYHTPTWVSNYDEMVDVLLADGRPVIGFCGHDHDHAEVLSWSNSAGTDSLTVYKAPAQLESGCWVDVTLGFADGDIVIDGMELHNYTDPDEWTINEPFTLVE